MPDGIDREHPIRDFFCEAVHVAISDKLGLKDVDDVENYLAELLVAFTHDDRVFAIRDGSGRTVRSVAEMIAEGDIRLRADSFRREREVHKHIGDFILFWSGVYPEFLERFRRADGLDSLIDYQEQGRESYFIVSTFDHGEFAPEAPTFRKLSSEFEAFRIGLNIVRTNLPGLKH
ncbi:MAG: hypothetical protein U0S12_04250 [Fimbriimonadales bacterium]